MASNACRSDVEGTRRKVRRQGMVVALRAMVRSRQLRSQVELCRLDFKLYICVRDWRVNLMKQRTREKMTMMRKERKVGSLWGRWVLWRIQDLRSVH